MFLENNIFYIIYMLVNKKLHFYINKLKEVAI